LEGTLFQKGSFQPKGGPSNPNPLPLTFGLRYSIVGSMNQIIGKLPFLGHNSTYSKAVEHYRQGNFEQAIEGFCKIVSQPQKAGVFYNLSLFYLKESYLQLGFAYEHLGIYKQAAEYFAAAAKISGHYPDIRYHLGLCLCFLEQFDRAKEELSQALKLNPSYTAALALLGFTYVKLHRLSEAAECYRKAIEINPRYADYHYLLGCLYGLWQQLDLAKEEFQLALDINPHYFDAREKIALIEQHCQNGQQDNPKTGCQNLIDEFSRAFATPPIDIARPFGPAVKLAEGEDVIYKTILFYEKAVQLNPNYADLHYRLGMYYAKKRLNQQAIESFWQALKINPGYIQAMIGLALTYLKTGALDQSIDTLHRAIAAQPHYADLHYYLGTLYAEKGNIEEAVGEFNQALAINPDYPECQAALAMVYEKLGQREQAAHWWNLYLKSYPHLEGREEIRQYIGSQLDEGS